MFASSVAMNRDIEKARKIYIDANIVIYFLEGDDQNQDKATTLFRYADENAIPMLTSDITIAECLHGAYKSGKDILVEKYKNLFHEIGVFHFVPVEQEIAERSAEIGAGQKLKLIDAIHVTSALSVGCDVFVTNDRRIKSTEELRVVQLLDL